MTRWLLTLVLLGLLFCSCEEQFQSENSQIFDKTVENSLQIFPGNVIETSSEKLNGVEVWRILIENDDGAQIEFFWQKSYHILYEVAGIKSPFNYELDLPLDVILFSTARFLAFESKANQELDSWNLYRNATADNELVFQFNLKNNPEPIILRASSGELL